MTASPVVSTRAMSKTGVISSAASDDRCEAANEAAPAVDPAAATASASTGGSRHTWGTTHHPPAATSARDATIRFIDTAVSITACSAALAGHPAPNGHRHQAHLYDAAT